MNLMKQVFTYGMLLLMASFLAACGSAGQVVKRDYEKFRAENPRSVLIVPAVNETVDVDAPDYFLSTISVPLAERGYYVFPVAMVQKIMNDDGLSDADMVHGADTIRLAQLFNADSVLYVTIKRWDAKYLVIQTTVTVEIGYELKSGKTGETLWDDNQKFVYESGKNHSAGRDWVSALAGANGKMVDAAVTRAIA
jgi:hypothetical protein